MKTKLWKLFLRIARSITLTVDDWIQAQEVKLRQEAGKQEILAEVDPAASAVRENAVRRERRIGNVVSNRVSTRPHIGRLKYVHGEFVRS
jgi:hypothetical protein